MSGGGWFILSDYQFKQNIQQLNRNGSFSILDKVKKLKPVSYTWKANEFPGLSLDPDKTTIGFIAQDVYELFPEIVERNKLIKNPRKKHITDQEPEFVSGYYAINYGAMIPILTQAIQEQQIIIENQNSKIEELEHTVNELRQLLYEFIKK